MVPMICVKRVMSRTFSKWLGSPPEPRPTSFRSSNCPADIFCQVPPQELMFQGELSSLVVSSIR